MLNAAGRFEVDEVAVFPDDADPAGFYAVSSEPAVARDGGDPAISFTVYGRREAGAFVANGGLLTLTTELAVPAAATGRLTQVLSARIAAGWPADSPEQPPRPTLFAAEWVESAVKVVLMDGLVLDGRPSLGAGNRCSFSLRLDRTQASNLVRAFRAGLPDATITYTGELRSGGGGAVGSGGGRSSSSTSWSSSTTTTSSTTSTSSSSTSTSSQPGSGPGGVSGNLPPVVVTRHTETHTSTGDSGLGAPCGAAAGGPPRTPAGASATPPARALIDVTARVRDSLPQPMDAVLFAEL